MACHTSQELYRDKLVSVDDQTIRIKRYYFPLGLSKSVRLTDIQNIRVLPVNLTTGAARIWGSGDFRTWFPLDWNRFNREKIFIMTLRSGRCRVGFTVTKAREFMETMRGQNVAIVEGKLPAAEKRAAISVFSTIAGVTVLFVALLIIGLAIPMAAGMVSPNDSYGVRTSYTLANPDLWYAVNRFGGYMMVLVNLPSIVLGVRLLLKRRTWPFWIGLVGLIALAPLNLLALGATLAYQQYLL